MCNDFLYSFLNSHRVQESNIPISQYTVTIKRRTATTAGAAESCAKAKKTSLTEIPGPRKKTTVQALPYS